MSDFTITHSPETQMAHTASSELVGAVLRDDYDGFAFYRACTAAELDEHLDAGREIIFGYDPDEIEQQLHAKFPIDSPVLRRVLRQDGYAPEAEEREWGTHRRNRYYYAPNRPEKKAACWLVLSHPFIDLEQLDQQETAAPASEILRQCIADYGLILVKNDYRSPERWKEHGFTFAVRNPDLLLLNFNPKRLAQKRFQEAVQAHEKLLRGFFPRKSLLDVYAVLQTLQNIHTPYEDVLRLAPITTSYLEVDVDRLAADSRGKCIAGCAAITANIRLALQLVRRLSPKAGAWWRDAKAGDSRRGFYASTVLTDLLPDLLPWLHGVELVCKYTPEQLDEINELANDEAQDNIQHLRWFCRWLRAEAKVAGLAIPPKPVAPKPPSSKKPKRRGSKGSAAKASRSRKKSVAPAPRATRTPSSASAS